MIGLSGLLSGTLVSYEQHGTSKGFFCCMLVSHEQLKTLVWYVSLMKVLDLCLVLVLYESIGILSGVGVL